MLNSRLALRKENQRYVDDFEITILCVLNDEGFIDSKQSLNAFMILCANANTV